MRNIPTPLQSSDRAIVLDILRGFALLGILLNNIYGFSGYGLLSEEQKKAFGTYPLDLAADYLQTAFVEGKFYSLFSLLFGIGFSIMLTRGEQKEMNALLIFYRRLFVLFIFGVIHVYFFWEGDILALYAVIGMSLPLFRKCADKTLLRWAVVLILLPIGFDALKVWLQWSPSAALMPVANEIDMRNGITDDNWRTFLYQPESGWMNWRKWMETGWLYRVSHLAETNRFPKVLGVFLIGLYAGRKLIHTKLTDYRPLLKKVLVWGFLIGLPMSMAFAWFSNDNKHINDSLWGFADTITYALGVVPLALGYAAAIALWYLKKPALWRHVAPVGRMALTMYLMQTLAGILLFYGAFGGLGQKAGLVWMFPVVLSIYFIQIIMAKLWLRYFDFGPLEWIWRQLTYGKRMRISRPKADLKNPVAIS